VEVHVFRIVDLVRPVSGLRSSDPNAVDRAPYKMIQLIEETVEPDSWAYNGGFGTLVYLDGCLVVRNAQHVQCGIVELLERAAELRRKQADAPAVP
jgi:hypothetical protein